MSVVINLYVPSASRSDLRGHLLESAFSRRSKRFIVRPNGGLDYFYWFEEKDYRSFNGVEAVIFETSESERREFRGGTLSLYTRTRAGASTFDREKQNEVIRTARKAFGGRFENDGYGVNRYTPIWDDPRTPAGRGIWLLYEEITDRLEAVSYVLPDEQAAFRDLPKELAVLREFDPSRVLYNALLPFLLAAIERFFRETFIILLRYDERAKNKIREDTKKIETREALAISKGERIIEATIADRYSFQNINQIHNAFGDWLGLDIWQLIRRDKKTKRAVRTLEEAISTLVGHRHDVVHGFLFDPSVDRQALLRFFTATTSLVDLLVSHLETDRDILIRQPPGPGF